MSRTHRAPTTTRSSNNGRMAMTPKPRAPNKKAHNNPHNSARALTSTSRTSFAQTQPASKNNKNRPQRPKTARQVNFHSPKQDARPASAHTNRRTVNLFAIQGFQTRDLVGAHARRQGMTREMFEKELIEKRDLYRPRPNTPLANEKFFEPEEEVPEFQWNVPGPRTQPAEKADLNNRAWCDIAGLESANNRDPRERVIDKDIQDNLTKKVKDRLMKETIRQRVDRYCAGLARLESEVLRRHESNKSAALRKGRQRHITRSEHDRHATSERKKAAARLARAKPKGESLVNGVVRPWPEQNLLYAHTPRPPIGGEKKKKDSNPPRKPKVVPKTSQEIINYLGIEVGNKGEQFIGRINGADPRDDDVSMNIKHKKTGFGSGATRRVGAEENGWSAHQTGWKHALAAKNSKKTNPTNDFETTFSPYRDHQRRVNEEAEKKKQEKKDNAAASITTFDFGKAGLNKMAGKLTDKGMKSRLETWDKRQNARAEVEDIRQRFKRLGIRLEAKSKLDKALMAPHTKLSDQEKQQFCNSMKDLVSNPFWKAPAKVAKKGGKKKKKQWKFQKKDAAHDAVIEGRFTEDQLVAFKGVINRISERHNMELFDYDWRLLPDQFSDLVGKDTRLLGEIQAMYKKYYTKFSFVFEFYSTPSRVKKILAILAEGGPDAEQKAEDVWVKEPAGRMSIMQYLSFCQICTIPDKVVRIPLVEDLFYICTKPPHVHDSEHRKSLAQKVFSAEAMMTRAQWFETLARLAILKFQGRLMYLDMGIAQSIETLYSQFIDIFAVNSSKNVSIQRQLLENDVAAVFKNYQEELREHFVEFADDNMKMTIANCIKCLETHYGVSDNGITVNLVCHSLENHDFGKLSDGTIKDPDANLLVYSEFLITCGMVAEKRYEPVDTSHSTPDVPLAARVKMLMTKQPPAGNADDLKALAMEEGLLDPSDI